MWERENSREEGERVDERKRKVGWRVTKYSHELFEPVPRITILSFSVRLDLRKNLPRDGSNSM